MVTKSVKYEALGFPITLINPPMVKTEFGVALNIDIHKLHAMVFECLRLKPGAYTGAELRFIRQYLEMSQNVFADLFKVDRSTVSKWETKDQRVADMGYTESFTLRMWMIRRKYLKKDVPQKAIEEADSTARAKPVSKPIEIDARKLAA